jgi:opacity protein-like surface antigen
MDVSLGIFGQFTPTRTDADSYVDPGISRADDQRRLLLRKEALKVLLQMRRITLTQFCSCNFIRSHRSIRPGIFASAIIAAACCLQVIYAQSTDTSRKKAKSHSEINISLGVFGQTTATRMLTHAFYGEGWTSFDQTTMGNSNSVGVLGTLHQSFRPWLGYSVNLGYTRVSEKFSYGGEATASPQQPGYICCVFFHDSAGFNMYELTAAPSVHGPRTTRMDTFAQLGGGVLSFLPTMNPSPSRVMFRPAGLFGAGLDYKLSPHWALRAEYRGLLYRLPDFRDTGGRKPYTVTHEPTISVVYRFGEKH